jgi:RNA polymerase sigma-70 factor (ECF subfamily)
MMVAAVDAIDFTRRFSPSDYFFGSIGDALATVSETGGAGDAKRGEAVAEDAELLRLAGSDPSAFRALLDRHAQYLYGVAYTLSQNAADAEDLVQETLLGAISGTYRGEASVRTWLVRILVNRAAMLRRSRKRRPEQAIFAEPSKAGAAASIDAKVDLSAMLDALSAEHRQVIVLRELEGLSYDEIAAALRVPRGTVESRLHRAREELRRRFKGYWTS